MFDQEIIARSQAIIDAASARAIRIATAESCTGGLISSALTEIPGSSKVLDRAFITYSNNAKAEMLGVKVDRLMAFGAVSAEIATDMANGAVKHSDADIAISVTGIAGPDGATPQKPVGLVFMALASKRGTIEVKAYQFEDYGRSAIRLGTVNTALQLILDQLPRFQP
ncbi:MAG: CinA family protein [Phyllobacteriaceae bacterium]|nr:CinA family protein [Phyllobacteriaceae bacterium]